MVTSPKPGSGLEGMMREMSEESVEVRRDPANGPQVGGWMVYVRLTTGQGNFYPLLRYEGKGAFYEIFSTLDNAEERIIAEFMNTSKNYSEDDFIIKGLFWEGKDEENMSFPANISEGSLKEVGS